MAYTICMNHMGRRGIRGALNDVLNNEQSRWYFVVNDSIAVVILISVVLLILETIPSIGGLYPAFFYNAEIVVIGLFTTEYFVRLWVAEHPLLYVRSFFGVIDAAAILPGFFVILLPTLFPLHSLVALRILRVLRILRTLRLVRWVFPTEHRQKIAKDFAGGLALFNMEIFFFAYFSFVVIAGSLMYAVESSVLGSPFVSIPDGMWWAIVTMTTVGYGDFVPVTALGKIVASLTMVSGLVLLAMLVAVVGRTMQTVLFGSPLEVFDRDRQ